MQSTGIHAQKNDGAAIRRSRGGSRTARSSLFGLMSTAWQVWPAVLLFRAILD